jgi:hypothetical protein
VFCLFFGEARNWSGASAWLRSGVRSVWTPVALQTCHLFALPEPANHYKPVMQQGSGQRQYASGHDKNPGTPLGRLTQDIVSSLRAD